MDNNQILIFIDLKKFVLHVLKLLPTYVPNTFDVRRERPLEVLKRLIRGKKITFAVSMFEAAILNII